MDIRKVSEYFSVSGQLSVDDLQALKDSGIRTLICNRPDGEAAGQLAHADIEKPARELGFVVHYLPVVNDTINANDVHAFARMLDESPAPVHAWCRSGQRATTLWCLMQIGKGGDSAMVVNAANATGTDFSTVPVKFAGVIREITGAFAKLPLGQFCPLLIVGGGSAGISLAASLLRRDPTLRISIIEPSDTHYYQPAFTLVGGGEYELADTRRNTSALIPGGVQWIKAAVTNFLPEQAQVVLDNGTRLAYEQLVVCAGLKLNWDAVPGLRETLGKNGVTSNYVPELAPYTWQLVRNLRRGLAVFTQPPMPIKCAGAPQKAMYLSADHWLRQGLLGHVNVHFYNAGAVLFGVKDFVPALQSYVERYKAQLHMGHNLVKVDGPRRIATFAHTQADGTQQLNEVTFDLLHVCPPQCAPDFIRNSPLADRAGWVEVDPATLRHKRYPNVWGLGDVTSTPNAKTAAAVRMQVPVLAENLLAELHNLPLSAIYEGYGACPLTVERGKIVLAEFGYGGKLQPTLPIWLIDGRKATWFAWLLKKYLMPWLYWHLMLRGWEPLARPAKGDQENAG